MRLTATGLVRVTHEMVGLRDIPNPNPMRVNFGRPLPPTEPTPKWQKSLQEIASALLSPSNALEGKYDELPIDADGSVEPFDPRMLSDATTLAGLATGSGGAPAEAGVLGMGLRAFHGSPYDFDAFDASKIGSGDGRQVYGNGLYFSADRQNAASYSRGIGKTYEVDLGADTPDLMDWDKPLSQQPPAVQAILGPLSKQGAASGMVDDYFPTAGAAYQGAAFANAGKYDAAAVSKALKDAGVKGAQYMGSSPSGNLARSYVMFDGAPIKILNKS